MFISFASVNGVVMLKIISFKTVSTMSFVIMTNGARVNLIYVLHFGLFVVGH